jgi:hypothetical protein
MKITRFLKPALMKYEIKESYGLTAEGLTALNVCLIAPTLLKTRMREARYPTQMLQVSTVEASLVNPVHLVKMASKMLTG